MGYTHALNETHRISYTETWRCKQTERIYQSHAHPAYPEKRRSHKHATQYTGKHANTHLRYLALLTPINSQKHWCNRDRNVLLRLLTGTCAPSCPSCVIACKPWDLSVPRSHIHHAVHNKLGRNREHAAILPELHTQAAGRKRRDCTWCRYRRGRPRTAWAEGWRQNGGVCTFFLPALLFVLHSFLLPPSFPRRIC